MNQHPDFLLNKIASPADLKQLSLAQLTQLASEIRSLILEKDSVEGGHLGPDLGIVETAIAWHYVFDAPKDKIVWDVSHQTYPHKMLTGRAYGWLDPDRYEEVTPYSNPDESPYDDFAIGHTSTSIALATGMAKARDLAGENYNVTALIGDGSLTGGLAFEGLNNAAVEKGNLIVVINDNQMSIDENVGGVVTSLQKLRESNGQTAENPFKALGFDYLYEDQGNDLEAMIKAFEAVKDTKHPIVLHINTLKGKGYQPAVENKYAHHWVLPFDLKTDKTTVPSPQGPTAASTVIDVVKDELEHKKPLLTINAAIPGVFGLDEIKKNYPEHYLDVGIAEQESLTLAAGAARNGAIPVVFQNSTFLQRAFDQLSHDIAANNLHVVMLVAGGGITTNSKTHLGVFDQVLVSNLPNWKYLAPTNLTELRAMTKWAIEQANGPVAIKEPVLPLPAEGKAGHDYSQIHYEIIPGEKVAILALGDFYQLGEKTQAELAKVGIKAALVNPQSANILDEAALDRLAQDYQVLVTLEDNAIDGGFGQKVASYLGDQNILVKNYAAPREYTDLETAQAIYQRMHLTPDQLASDIQKLLG
ncbi:1-deoxy-D-xylulose-5-phosphate synthase [Lactobacillus corticis]|uniref:1-deoxy-D-xylulose-5-phosphate synthase n=1 Tax=Lactobacillus corticis TaxID=2201249 RepID=A0A916VI19_9LACO|nr:1-deoxy-D-xylulose-5-phosphate synthase [Lactobacillus corticis]GFZ27287.1 1-deoxy-D-xylulose-5-phosphate synthase [Lactobacillus corticis]